LEGLDHRLVELEHSRRLAEKALRQLPDGNAWLMVQINGDNQDDADRKAKSMIDALQKKLKVDSTVLDDPTRKKEVWAAREAGLGATAYPPNEPETHEGWEDAAVPPDRLGDYLRDFHRLLDRYDYGTSSLYGHFGQGCVHTRIPFMLRTAEGVAKYRAFVEDSARLVVKYGGSLSGEHGDGQSRGELLPIMFGERMVGAFEQTKALFDPHNRMNPGKVVHPNRLDENLRLGVDYRPAESDTEFAYPDDGHRFSRAAARCVGVGKCRGHESGVMCPSYRATGEEEHSTRGRARLLFEMLEGDVITDGWRSTEVRDALDLCLACKGCRSDCPVDVDMATYKAEFLFHHYRGRPRPMAHYSMGWIPLWARLAALMPRALNTVTHADGLATLVKKAGGIAPEREMPNFADQRFTKWFAQRPATAASARERVVLWPDTFVNNFDPEVGQAAVAVLEAAGFDVEVPGKTVCCGLTWISTGQLRVAKRVLRRTLKTLSPALRTSTPVVVLEPSCAAVFRSDLPELLYGDEDAHRLSKQTFTIGEFLAHKAPQWDPPQITADAVVQQHCHQHAVLDSYSHERQLLADAGVEAEVLDAGCCGLAGNFGFENGHYDVSVACAEDKLLPALRGADPDALVLADGFSCRTQIRALATDRRPLHIAQILAAALPRSDCLG
jgi:Fe-S oxidoreductase